MVKQQLQPPQQSDFGPQQMYAWLKNVEMKVNTLVREVDILKNDVLRKTHELQKEAKVLDRTLLEIKQENQELTEKIGLLVQEVQKRAGEEDVRILRRYVDLWNPMHFVTQKDVERLVTSLLEEKKKKM